MLRDPNCRDCGLWQSSHNVCISGDGPMDADVLAVGEAPGEKEAKTGRPFTGRSGQLLRTELARAGLHSVRITNVVRCRPPNNRAPTPTEIKACRKYMDAELAAVKPKYVLALGAVASKAMAKKAKITEAHGQLVEMPGYTVMPAFHPAYALRDPSKLAPLQHDLELLAQVLQGKKLNSDIPWMMVNTKTFGRFVEDLRECDEFSFDTETPGLFPHHRDKLVRCISFGLPHVSWLLPLDMPGYPLYGKPEAQRRIIQVIHQLLRDKIAVAQNGKFDNMWLYVCYGIRFYLNFDVMLASHLLNENEPHDLKYLARSYLGVAEYDIPTKWKKDIALMPDPMIGFEYCAKDGFYTLQLKQLFQKKLKQDISLRRLYYRLIMPAARVMQDVELDPLTIDMPKFASTEEAMKVRHATQLTTLNKLAGRTINWNSPQQISKLLFGDLKLPVTVKTDKGNPSTGEEALIDLKDKHPIAKALVEYRETEKFLSTYIEGWKEFMVDEKLYLGYKLHGTVTGRWSSRLHQVPRDGQIRNLVIAPPGWEFGQADLSQAELRIAAELSGDLELITCFRPGGQDVHWRTLLYMIGAGTSGEYAEPSRETAQKIVGSRRSISESIDILAKVGHNAAIAIWKGWKEGRKKAKAINFGFVFGMYENKFIENAKTKYGWEPTWDEAHEFRQAYFELYRGIIPWHERQKKLAHYNGYVRNLFGRLRRLPGVASRDRELRGEAERQSINSPVQGTIGDWKAAALVEIHQTINRDELRIVGEHHDAILFIVRSDEQVKRRVLPRLREIMRKPKLLETFKIDTAVPMDSEIEIGPWGAGKSYKFEDK